MFILRYRRKDAEDPTFETRILARDTYRELQPLLDMLDTAIQETLPFTLLFEDGDVMEVRPEEYTALAILERR